MSDVTVVVPSYNHAPFVERTLRSIFAQTLLPGKLIVIDDGSKDESGDLIRRVLADSPIESELIERENRGLSATLNEGLAAAEGEYFAYLGSDDVWLPEFLAEQTALLDSRPDAPLAFSHCYLIDENDAIIDCTANWTDYADGDLRSELLRGNIFLSPGVVYRRRAIEKYGWNEESVLEDYELYLRLTAEGEFAFNRKVLAAWRQHGWNTSSNIALMRQEWIAAQNRVAGELGIERAELDRIQRRLKFDSVFDYIRSGDRGSAFRAMRENLAGARSLSHAANAIVRLAVPQALFQWNRRRKREASARRYGRLKIG